MEVKKNFGVIDDRAEVVEWKIPNFFSVFGSPTAAKCIESPDFSSAGCIWSMKLQWKMNPENNEREYVSISLIESAMVSVEKNVTVILGLKKANGTLKEYFSVSKTSNRGAPITMFLDADELKGKKSSLVPSGTLTLTCRILATNDEDIGMNSSERGSQQVKLVGRETLSSDFRDLLFNDGKCDTTIRVQDTEFRAHRSVLMSRSSVFRAMFEHDTSENKTGLLTIPDCDPNSFGHFLKYLYSGKLEELTFRTACQLYAIAEKYNVQELKPFCVDCMKDNLTAENICDVASLAELHEDIELQSAVQDFFSENCRELFPTVERTKIRKATITFRGQKGCPVRGNLSK